MNQPQFPEFVTQRLNPISDDFYLEPGDEFFTIERISIENDDPDFAELKKVIENYTYDFPIEFSKEILLKALEENGYIIDLTRNIDLKEIDLVRFMISLGIDFPIPVRAELLRTLSKPMPDGYIPNLNEAKVQIAIFKFKLKESRQIKLTRSDCKDFIEIFAFYGTINHSLFKDDMFMLIYDVRKNTWNLLKQF